MVTSQGLNKYCTSLSLKDKLLPLSQLPRFIKRLISQEVVVSTTKRKSQ